MVIASNINHKENGHMANCICGFRYGLYKNNYEQYIAINKRSWSEFLRREKNICMAKDKNDKLAIIALSLSLIHTVKICPKCATLLFISPPKCNSMYYESKNNNNINKNKYSSGVSCFNMDNGSNNNICNCSCNKKVYNLLHYGDSWYNVIINHFLYDNFSNTKFHTTELMRLYLGKIVLCPSCNVMNVIYPPRKYNNNVYIPIK